LLVLPLALPAVSQTTRSGTGTPASQSSTAAAPPAGAASLPAANTLLDGTPVKLRLSQTISSADAKVGQEVPFEVLEELKVGDVVVLPKGATAIATVTEAEHKKSMGRAGKLNVNITYARLADNEKLALRAVKEAKGGGHVGAMTGAIVATSIIFFPAAPLFLFVHGKDITIPQGTEITSFVDGDMHLDMARFQPAGFAPGSSSPTLAGTTPAAPAQASMTVDSTPPDADIEVDGNFVGDTPSTVSVATGSHEILVKKQGFADWSRKLNVTGGNVHVAAALQQQATQ
ncbi:MAG: PEGA domain-containing protein, partial [Terracidiphilus sp.]